MKDVIDTITVGVRLEGSQESVRHTLDALNKNRDLRLRPMPFPGGWPVLFKKVISDDLLNRYAERGTRIPRLEGINGGEVAPHFHLGDDLIYLTREQFQTMVGDMAKEMTTTFAKHMDFESTVDLMGHLAIDTIPLPE